MRYLILTFFLLLFHFESKANDRRADSLVRRLEVVSPPAEKINIYRNLADLNHKPSARTPWLIKAYKLSAQNNYIEQSLDALSELSMTYLKVDNLDSAKYYTTIMANIVSPQQRDMWLSMMAILTFNTEVYLPESTSIIASKIEQLKGGDSISDNVYKRIEHAYVMGMALFVQENFQGALPHIELAVGLVRKLSAKQAINYKIYTKSLLGRIYANLRMHAKSIDVIEECIADQEQYFKQYIRPSRPYYNMNSFYVRHYTSLMMNVRAMTPQKADYYLDRMLKLSKTSSDSAERYNCFLCLNNYYMSQKSWPMALVTIDSMINYAYGLCPYNLPGLYSVSSIIHGELGQYKEALSILRKSYKVQDSISHNENQTRINELQVEYEVGQLNYEKSKLEIRNRRLWTTVLVIVLAFVLIVCVYLYITLRREKIVQEDLRMMKLRAEESEKMKSAFINSICHEVRTPLNAIAGFSSVIADPSTELDQDSRQGLVNEIFRNTDQLTSLINSMIEVASLNVSDEQLPCEPTNITDLCVVGMMAFRSDGNTSVEYRMDVPQEPVILSTNAHYLSLVIENLLSNSRKFTKQGHVILSYNVQATKLVICIQDTGCGIPAEFRNSVFDRFMKINPYTDGSGLGLYLCRLIVTRLSGIIYVDDTYDNGARVIVELPLR